MDKEERKEKMNEKYEIRKRMKEIRYGKKGTETKR